LPKNAEKCQILAIFVIFGQNAGKTRFFGLLGLKWPFSGLFGPGAQGFYINPRRARPGGRGTLPGAWEPGDQGSRGPGGLGTSGIPDPGSRGPGSPLPPGRGGLGRSRDRSREAPRTGFYINPSRRPPAVPGRGPGDSESHAGAPRGSGRPPRRPWTTPSPGGTPRRYRGRGSPHRGRGEDPLLLPEEGRPV